MCIRDRGMIEAMTTESRLPKPGNTRKRAEASIDAAAALRSGPKKDCIRRRLQAYRQTAMIRPVSAETKASDSDPP